MKRTIYLLILISIISICSIDTFADTYSTFVATKYYSHNRKFFVEVTENMRATLYQNSKRAQKIWSKDLDLLPDELLVTDDGNHIAIIDQYYGNQHNTETRVVLIFNEKGDQIASYKLGELADISKVPQSTSNAYWIKGLYLTRDNLSLIIETTIVKCTPEHSNANDDESIKRFEECQQTLPYEELNFSLKTGQLLSRINIKDKYADPVKLMQHEIELIELADSKYKDEYLPYRLLRLAAYYDEHHEYEKAEPLYQRAVPLLKPIGVDYNFQTIGQQANHYRDWQRYDLAEKLYQKVIKPYEGTALNKIPGSLITIWQDYAKLLDILKRADEAEKLRARAKALEALFAR